MVPRLWLDGTISACAGQRWLTGVSVRPCLASPSLVDSIDLLSLLCLGLKAMVPGFPALGSGRAWVTRAREMQPSVSPEHDDGSILHQS